MTLSRRPLPIKMSSACSSYCPILAETVHYSGLAFALGTGRYWLKRLA
ncbi:MAG: hypothetical protein GPJ01_22670 [Microcystis aeruginosa LL13-06]|nr:hypothetical protein [Microcystis aeruginosa LL13-06]